MKRKKNGGLVIFLGLLAVVIAIGAFYFVRIKQKEKFDKLLNSPSVLSVNFGEVEIEKKLQENNRLLRRIDKDNIFYLNINENNILYTYYNTWYYRLDPMQGYVKTFEQELTKEQIDTILSKVRENMVENLTAKIKDDYLLINIDDKNMYIKKDTLQSIIQEHEIIIPAFSGKITSIK